MGALVTAPASTANPPISTAQSTPTLAIRITDTGFLCIQSEHFVLCHDPADHRAAGILTENGPHFLDELERTLDRFQRFRTKYELPDRASHDRLQVIVATDRTHLQAIAGENAAPSIGAYDPASQRVYLDLRWFEEFQRQTDATPLMFQDDTGTPIEITLRHEAFHQLIARAYPNLARNLPDWLAEGLACMFEPSPVEQPESKLPFNILRFQDVPKAHRWILLCSMGRQPAVHDQAEEAKIIRDMIESVDYESLRKKHADITKTEWYALACLTASILHDKHPDVLRGILQAYNRSSTENRSQTVLEWLDAHGLTIDQSFVQSGAHLAYHAVIESWRRGQLRKQQELAPDHSEAEPE